MTIIALEGLDGSGKTTIANWLKDHADMFGYKQTTVHAFPYKPGRELPEPHQATPKHPSHFDRDSDWLVWAMNYYQQMHYLSLKLRAAKPNELVILDRWYYSTAAYAPGKMRPKVREKILTGIREACEHYYQTKLRAPDLWVYLRVDPEKPLRRAPQDPLDLACPARRAQIAARYEHFFKHDPYAIRLNTDTATPEHVGLEILRCLKPAYFALETNEQ